jgi:NAD(P)-dependent dehydrogenase (short-subunit alcohol dehydrogenase family)
VTGERSARFRLDGKAMLVTGGASGIGAATCRAFV